jgi:hypothetical protein
MALGFGTFGVPACGLLALAAPMATGWLMAEGHDDGWEIRETLI